MSWKEQEQEKEQEQGQNKVKLQKTKKVQNTKTKKENGLVMNVIAYIINRLAEPSTLCRHCICFFSIRITN